MPASTARTAEVVDGLGRDSDALSAMWADDDVITYGEGTKLVVNPIAGALTLHYSAFAVDGQRDLGTVVYKPATSEDADRIRLRVDWPALAAGRVMP